MKGFDEKDEDGAHIPDGAHRAHGQVLQAVEHGSGAGPHAGDPQNDRPEHYIGLVEPWSEGI